jgi:ribosomal protein L12E/L44/L45/RPP1/RPP2
MRFLTRLFQASSLAAILLTASMAAAENRIFIVANDADGYGIDRCLASGESCGAAAAAAYCRTRDFAQAAAYRRVNRAEITNSAAATDGSCRGGSCMQFVAIECTR